MLRGDADWADITADAMYSTCWIIGAGMRGAYTYKNISVTRAALPSGLEAKKSHLIEFLKQHPEGVALFDANKPHAVILTDYTDGQFYYADSSSGAPSGRMVMTNSSSVTISTADNYWYVQSEPVTIQSPDLMTIETPTKDETYNGDYITVKGWSVSMKGVTSVRCVVNDAITFDCKQTERIDIAELNPGYPTGNEGFECDVPAYSMIDGVNTIRVDSYSGDKVINSAVVNINYTYKATRNITDGVYYVQSVADEDYVLSVKDSTITGTNLTVDAKSELLIQKFNIKHIKDGYYHVIVSGTDMSIGSQTGAFTSGTNITLVNNENVDANNYIIKSAGNGEYYIIADGGYYISAQTDTLTTGAGIIADYCSNKATQRWRFINADPDKVVWGDSNDDMCVDIKDAVLLKQYIAGAEVKMNMTVSDVNADSKVDIKDAVKFMKHLAGAEVVLGQSDN